MSVGKLPVNCYTVTMKVPGGQYQNVSTRCQPVRLSMVDRLTALLAGWRCVLCGDPASGMDLCVPCLNDLPWLGAACRKCGLPRAVASEPVCGPCRATPPDIARTIMALQYEYPVRQLIAELKFRKGLAVGRVLGELLAIALLEQQCEPGWLLPDLLVPVPLHPLRELVRSYNQATVIAERIATVIPVSIHPGAARRKRNTPPQSGHSRRERLSNIRGSFTVDKNLSGARVAIIDDVVTTGSTVRELAKEMRGIGVAEVQIWAVARA